MCSVPFAGMLMLNNNTGSYNFTGVYYALTSSDSWGVVLEPGDRMTFTVPSIASYDFRCVDVDDDTYSLWGIWV